jgi:MFS family permease
MYYQVYAVLMKAIFSHNPVPSSPKRSQARKDIFTGACSLAIAIGIGRFAMTPLLPSMRNEALLNVEQSAELSAIHFLGYLLGAATATWLRGNIRLILVTLLLGIAVSVFVMGTTTNYGLWLALRGATGFFSAWVFVLCSQFYGARIARYQKPQYHGSLFSGVGAGICFTGLLCIVLMLLNINSASSWILLGITALIGTVVVAWISPASDEMWYPFSQSQSEQRRSFSGTWHLMISYGVTGFAYIIPATYLPLMAQQQLNSPLIFGGYWPVLGLCAAVSTTLTAPLLNRYSALSVWIGSHLVMGGGLLVAGLLPCLLSYFIAACCVGLTFMVVTMVAIKEVHTHYCTRSAPLIIALTTSFATGQILGPLVAGWLFKHSGNFSVALQLSGGLLYLTSILLYFFRANTKELNTYETLS